MCTVTPVSPATQPPAALYDLSARLGAARSVASCALESLPSGGLSGMDYNRINHTSYLITAIEELLKLCTSDLDSITSQLEGV